MKNVWNYRTVLAVLLFAATALQASNQPKEVVTVSTARVGSSLVKHWMARYKVLHPEVEMRLLEGANRGEADLQLVVRATEGKQRDGLTTVGRVALLPVTTVENPRIKRLTRRPLDAKELKQLFFEGDERQAAEQKEEKSTAYGLTIYTGTSRTSGSAAWAAWFGYPSSRLRGNRIAGDDIHLLAMLGRDSVGVTINNTAYLFDLESRHLKPHLSLLPLDVKKEQNDILQSGNLDDTLRLLEEQHVDLVPMQEIAFKSEGNPAATGFLSWVLSEGIADNHRFGFLEPSSKHK